MGKVTYYKCIHGNLMKDGCRQCEEDKRKMYDYIAKAMQEPQPKPIRRGCPNVGSPCFCTGICNEIVGHEEVEMIA